MSYIDVNDRKGDFREVLKIAFPLVVSSSVYAIKLFCDRLMLAWYSEFSISAALSAGMFAFALVAIFMGITTYAGTFVAQYFGAGQERRIGLVIWQAIILCLCAGLLIALLGNFLAPLFYHFNHVHILAKQEEAYFRILTSGSVFSLLVPTLGCFWTGRNRTWVVVSVNFLSILFNVIFNWALIFGFRGSNHLSSSIFPVRHFANFLNYFASFLNFEAMGVTGAGLATVGTDAMVIVIFLLIFLCKSNREVYLTFPRRIFDFSLMARMIKYGLGNGIQFFMDIGSFSIFNILMSTYGLTSTGANIGAASGVVISINGLAYIPMLGFGLTTSILVAQGIGARNVFYAKRAVRSVRRLILIYVAFLCVLFLLFSSSILSIFSSTGSFSPATLNLSRILLYFIAGFWLADSFFMVYSNAIRGAGDTKFAMLAMTVLGWGFFAIPSIIAYSYNASHLVLWSILLAYILLAGTIFYWRYRQGKWQYMRVIEDNIPAVLSSASASSRISSRHIIS